MSNKNKVEKVDTPQENKVEKDPLEVYFSAAQIKAAKAAAKAAQK